MRFGATIEFVAAGGESLNEGGQGSPLGAAHAAPVPRGLMLASGLRGTAAEVYGGEDTLFVPARERRRKQLGSTGGLALLRWLDANAGGDEAERFVYRTHGRAGATLAEVAEGSTMFENGVFALAVARRIAAAAGATLTCRYVKFTLGANDRSAATPADVFAHGLAALCAAYRTRYAAVLATPAAPIAPAVPAVPIAPAVPLVPAPRIFLDQLQAPRSMASKRNVVSAIGDAQLALARAEEGVHLVTPKYFLPLADNVHLTAQGYDLLGEYHAKAFLRRRDGGATRFCPMPLVESARVDGARVLVDVASVPDPAVPGSHLPLMFDAFEGMSLAPAQGFSVREGGSELATGATVVADGRVGGIGTVAVALRRERTGPIALEYAWRGIRDEGDHSCAWGNLCDADPARSAAVPGRRLANWAAAFRTRL